MKGLVIMLDKKYDHIKTEEGKYKKWLDSGYFNSDNKSS